MLELNTGQSGEKIIVTLTELQTLDEPYYLFRFVHVVTKQVVSFIKGQIDDESDYPSRYNQFDVDTAVVFLNKPVGGWHYEAYEQPGAVNTDPALATTLLESGKMLLYAATAFEYEKYNEPVTFKTYNG
jgi:hypothetical protein